MGILDSKSRIIDAIITVEGRRQMAEGTFNVSFATFTDNDVVYESDLIEGHVDPTDRIYLEAKSLPQDQIIFEANDSGKIVPLRDKTIDIQRIDSLLPRRVAASFVDGKAIAYQINYGTRVKVSSISEKFKEAGVGFSYYDSNGKFSSVILDKNIKAGTISSSLPDFSYVGVKGGINSVDLTTAIQRSIEIASSGSGPKVEAVDRENYIYITDISGSHEKVATKLVTGSMGSFTASLPFIIEESLLGGRPDVVELPNAVFASQIDGILSSSFDNFQELRTLSTIDPIFFEDKFNLTNNEINFDISRLDKSIKDVIKHAPSLNSIDSIFNDDKLSNLDNFRYLPPIIKVSDTTVTDKSNLDEINPYLLGNYPPLGDNKKQLSFQDISKQVSNYFGEKISFVETSRKNNILCQLFEVADGTVKKLDLINYGDVKNDSFDATVVSNKVYFAGKTFLDDRGTTCYVNMFTLIFSRREGDEE
jgi:hypothetical protein